MLAVFREYAEYAQPVGIAEGAKQVLLDVRGEVRDEQNRAVATIKDTLDVPASGDDTLAKLRSAKWSAGAVRCLDNSADSTTTLSPLSMTA